ncbi:MAG: hypothetical protein IPN15_05415 [Saprospiraceae bacterium]|nr:hypothetical protein [Candidatus Vicinibacter affinis]
MFTHDKILVQRTRRGMKRKLVCYYDNEQYYNLNRISNIVLTNKLYSLKYLYILLNSELMDFYFNKYFNEYEIKPLHLSKLPIKILSIDKQQPIIDIADKILLLNRDFQGIRQKFLSTLERKFNLKELSNKVREWYANSYSTLLNELSKRKIRMTLSEEAEWEEYFNSERKKAIDIKSEIEKTDKEIDQMVYKLYELTEEEIKIVEESVN